MLRLIPKQTEKLVIPPALAALDLPQRLLELLLQRGMDTPQKINQYLHPVRGDLHDPMRMQDMDKAVSVIRDALSKQEEIVVFGDYDVDGVAATAILLTYLRKQGAQVSFYIPDRHGEGYGLNLHAVQEIASHAKLLITVDCGITCPVEVARARELGMRVIVTDHHQLGDSLPVCEAVLNPLLGAYPFRRLCGAGVAFKLVQAIGGMEAVEPLWELAALATIADIVPLVDENRVIVTYGLQAMAQTQRPGLLALMESAGVSAQKVSASDVAFRMAPRINAGGRLALASRSVELLTTRRLETAREIAQELNQDNTKRRELELEIFAKSDEITRREIDFDTERAIVVCGTGWNPGVIGLAASRLVEKYHWPAILLTQEGELCVGSARSIPGVNIYQALSACADLFVRFGGHAQAAGLTIEAARVPELRRRLTEAIEKNSEPDAFLPAESYDLELELSEMTEELIAAFEAMQPTGFGNPAPIFCVRGVHTTDVRTIGKDGAHLRMRLVQGSSMRSAIGFRMGERAQTLPEVVEATLTLSINSWQDRRSVQCELRQMQAYMPAKAFMAQCQRQEQAVEDMLLKNLALTGTPPDARIERMPFEQVKQEASEALRVRHQGTLLCVHTIAALRQVNIHMAVMRAQVDYALHAPADIHHFNTLLMAPDWERVDFKPGLIAVLDGLLSDGERALLAERFPKARIIEASDMAQYADAQTADLLPTDDALRTLYRVLRQQEKTVCSPALLAQQTALSERMVRCGMLIFAQLHLLEVTDEPFAYRLLPSGRVSLEDSTLRGALLRMRK